MIQRNNEILQDALGLLLDNYHKIMRVNLTTDTFEEVGVREDEAKELNQEAISLSEWFLNFAQSENIYDEDREEFIAFVNFNYLIQELLLMTEMFCGQKVLIIRKHFQNR